MPELKEGVLSQYDLAVLKKEGVKIDDTKDALYYALFLFNDKLNEATDPIPFQIPTSSLDKIAETFIGRPHVVRPEDIADDKVREKLKVNVGEHVRGPIDDPKKIIEFQKNYAIGDMFSYYKTKSNNVYGLYAAYPEYEDLILERKIPRGTSPLLEPRKMEGHILHDAIGLHVQSVGATGYDPQFAKITGTCQGMLNECTSMLRTMGASKQLLEYRRNLLNSTKQQDETSMPDDNKITELENKVKSLETDLTKANETIKSLGANGSKQTLEIPKEIQDKLSKFETIEKENIENKKVLETIKKEREDEKARAAEAKRLQKAEIIANGEILTKEYPEDKLDERKKYWMELKGEDGTLQDISLLADKFQKMIPKSVGSSGLRVEDLFPQMGGNSAEKSTFDIMEDIRS